MAKKILNPCTRCGKERVVVKVYKEKVGNSTLTHTMTACPDLKCQKLVNNTLLKEKQKRSSFKKESEKRELLRQKRIQIARKK